MEPPSYLKLREGCVCCGSEGECFGKAAMMFNLCRLAKMASFSNMAAPVAKIFCPHVGIMGRGWSHVVHFVGLTFGFWNHPQLADQGTACSITLPL